MALRSRTAIALVLLCPAACAGNPVESAESGSVGGSSTGNADSGASASTTKGSSTNSDTTQGTSASSTTSASDVTSASDPTLTSGNDSGTGSDTDPGTSHVVDPTTDGGGSSSGGNAATSNVSGGSSGGGACDDENEPNDSYNIATPLAGIDCTTAPTEVADVMDPTTGEDWFEYFGSWTCGTPEPIARVAVLEGPALDFCLYPSCAQLVGTFYSCQTGENNPNAGCCNAPGESEVDMWINCADTDDESATVWVQFFNPGNACEPYSFEYSFLSDG